MHQKAILSPHTLTPSRKPLELFIFWIFMLCVVFFFHFFYIEPTIFLREMCMANGQEWGILHGSKSTQELLVCLFVRQMSKQRKKQRYRPHTNCHSLHSIDTLEKQNGDVLSLSHSCSLAHTPRHHPIQVITRQVHSSIWMTLRTPRANCGMHVPDISPIWGTS